MILPDRVAASRRSRFDVEPEEGEAPLEASSHRHSRPPSAAGVPDFDSITRVAPASRCVWLHGVPRRLSMTAIGDECSRYGSVAAVLPGQEPDEAVVVFTTIRYASLKPYLFNMLTTSIDHWLIICFENVDHQRGEWVCIH